VRRRALIRLIDSTLPANTANELVSLQQTINIHPRYVDQVVAAKRLFSAQNVKGSKTFDVVKSHLDTICCGARRCGYCEDSCADEVEHIWPKDIYPDRTFRWSNYLYACGPCNAPKGNNFAIYRSTDGRRVDVTPARGQVRRTPAPQGDPLLIDPRCDDPLEYLLLDLLGTFKFIPHPKHRKYSRSWQRAAYTIDILHLNDRDALIRARRSAFDYYLRYIGDCIRLREAGDDQSVKMLRAGLNSQAHPTVWREMTRQSKGIPALAALFAQAPYMLDW